MDSQRTEQALSRGSMKVRIIYMLDVAPLLKMEPTLGQLYKLQRALSVLSVMSKAL